ncbi:MAG TPA: hypothetical protein VGF90_06530 [Verrucomicrobiae bacterium]
MQMKLILICLTSMMMGLAHAEVPKLFSQKNFSSANIAEAVNRYVAIGEASSLKELQQLAAQDNSENDNFLGKGFSVKERVGWVCRILYEPKGRSPLRAPEFGELPLPEKSMPAEKWPLYPLALSGSTYVALKQGYIADGTPEEVAHYLKYCKNNGVFRKTPIEVPTREQAESDIVNLRQSAEWQAIQWRSNDGFNYPMGEQLTWAFIKGQSNTIAEQPLASRVPKPDSSALSLR